MLLKPEALKHCHPFCRYYRAYCPKVRGAGWMTPFERPDRCCPKCEHKGYLFRARKTVDLPEGKVAETKYRCRSCSHEWWERIPAPPAPKPSDEAA